MILPDDADPTVLGNTTTPPCTSLISWAVTAFVEPVRSPDEKDQTKPGANLGINVYNSTKGKKPTAKSE